MLVKTMKLPYLVMIALLLAVGCSTPPQDRANLQKIQSSTPEAVKPVIVILIDSLMDKPLREAIQQGRAPALQFLLSKGQYYPQMVSSFPTMSVTIDSTFLTGTYADQHQVPGLVWYSGNENRLIYYGNGPKEALKIDQVQQFIDSVYELNQNHLSKKTKTIHEELAEKGKHSASINAIIYRGKTEHSLHVPTYIEKSTRLPEEMRVKGPSLLSYAALAQLDPQNRRNARLWKKYGLNNQFSAQDIAYLIEQRKLPDVTIAYFPENDMSVHNKGSAQTEGIVKADQALQIALNAYGSWEQAVHQAVWIVMGDSGQTDVREDRQAATIDLRSLLSDYRIAKIGQPVKAADQLVIAANERMSYIYAIDSQVSPAQVVKHLQKEDKLDIIAMKDSQNVQVTAGKSNQTFSYRPKGKFVDEYGQSWTWTGDPRLLDMTITNNRITYGKYPDVLARLYGAMHSHEGKYVVITVKPGYELAGENSPSHRGGAAHGSLHAQDSHVPILVTGTDTRPKTLRIVDLKDWILQLVK